ncbi:MAG: hypothetical protein HGA65_08130 [Oscillochloris sp.]|nr:hypothetical protein [Oscillochloris sp.]
MTASRTTAQPASTERPSTETQIRSGTWTAAQKLAILSEYESYPKGDPRRGALLRRHGLYTSQISKWRTQRASGTLTPRSLGYVSLAQFAPVCGARTVSEGQTAATHHDRAAFLG